MDMKTMQKRAEKHINSQKLTDFKWLPAPAGLEANGFGRVFAFYSHTVNGIKKIDKVLLGTFSPAI